MQREGKINYLVVAFLVVQVIFVIFLCLTIPRLAQEDEIQPYDFEAATTASIGNLTALAEGLSEDSVPEIEQSLFGAILANSSSESLTEKMAAAEIRADSVKTVYFEQQNVNYFYGIVDVPDLKQSYQFFLQYSDDAENTYVDYVDYFAFICLSEEEQKIYTDFTCKNVFAENTPATIVRQFLSYFEFNEFSAFISDDDVWMVEINPTSALTLSEETKAEYISLTKEAIASLGISAELFNYHVMTAADYTYEI